MKPTLFILLFLSTSAYGVALHYGKYQTDLTTTKHTTPSVNTIYNDVHYYGALFTNDAPENTLRFLVNGTKYWLGPWCDAGTHATGGNQCSQCGIGHYCTGGIERDSCTYGIIGCPNSNHTSDPEMPTGTENIYNRILTMSEVELYLPPTTLDDWEPVFFGMPGVQPEFYLLTYDERCYLSPNDPRGSNTNMVLSAGTYLVVHRYGEQNVSAYSSSDALYGEPYTSATAYIIIFDHNVSYRPVDHCNYVFNFFDTNNTPFNEFTLRIPNSYYATNENVTNIENLGDDLKQINKGSFLGVFKLK